MKNGELNQGALLRRRCAVHSRMIHGIIVFFLNCHIDTVKSGMPQLAF